MYYHIGLDDGSSLASASLSFGVVCIELECPCNCMAIMLTILDHEEECANNISVWEQSL
jgi:hypothetical protein